MLLKLHTFPDAVLREVAKPVAAVDAETVRFMQDMLETMYHHRGVGLAAPQVGVGKRVIVVDINEPQDPAQALLMANPEILQSSEEEFCYNEGCLSVPGQYADVTRPKKVRVAYINIHNQRVEMEAEDLLSTCIQHEIDHLNGELFVDHLSRLKRDIILKKVEKARRLAEEEIGHAL
jgi:peptide deformylase